MAYSLKSSFLCFECGGNAPLKRQTLTVEGVTVYDVPVYVCECGNESIELACKAAVEQAIRNALDGGRTEVRVDDWEQEARATFDKLKEDA